MEALFDLALFLGPSAAWIGPLAIASLAAGSTALVERAYRRWRDRSYLGRAPLRSAKGLPIGPAIVRGRLAANASVVPFGGGPGAALSAASLPGGGERIEVATRSAEGLRIELASGTVRIEGEMMVVRRTLLSRRSFGSLSSEDRDAIARTGADMLDETAVELASVHAGVEVIARGELVEDLEAPTSSGYRENVRARKLIGTSSSPLRIYPMLRGKLLPAAARSLAAGLVGALVFSVVSVPQQPDGTRGPGPLTPGDVAGLFGPAREQALRGVAETIRASVRDTRSLGWRRAIARAEGCTAEAEVLEDVGAWAELPSFAADCPHTERSNLLALRADGRVDEAAAFAVDHAEALGESSVTIALLDAGRFADAATHLERAAGRLRERAEETHRGLGRMRDAGTLDEARARYAESSAREDIGRADDLTWVAQILAALASATPPPDDTSGTDPLWLAATGHADELATQHLVSGRTRFLELVIRGPRPDDALYRFAEHHEGPLRGWLVGDAAVATAALEERVGMRALLEGDAAEAHARFETLRAFEPDRAAAHFLVIELLGPGRGDADASARAALPSELAGDLLALRELLEGDEEAMYRRDREVRALCEGVACARQSAIFRSETDGGSGDVVAGNMARRYGMMPSVLLVIHRTTSERQALADHLRLRRRALSIDSPLDALAHAAWLDHVFAHALGDTAWAAEADARLERLRAALDADHAVVAQLATDRLLDER